MTGHLTDAAPFESLEVMKARHKELLRTAPPGESASALRTRVLEFLARGTATGLVLDDPADRRVAQGLLDYWKATLYTQLREAEVEPAAPCPTTTVLKDFPEDDSAKLVAAAEAAVESMPPEDRDLARRLLQRLARLEPAVREFHPVAVPRTALDELGNVGQVVRVMHALEKAGVIRSSIDAPRRIAGRSLPRATSSAPGRVTPSGSRIDSPSGRPPICGSSKTAIPPP